MKRLWAILMAACLPVAAQIIPSGTLPSGPTAAIVGQLQTATGGSVKSGTLTFSLSQPAVAVGSTSVVTQASSCYTSTQGSIAGIPDPVVVPVLSTNTASGSLAAATYYVVLFYLNASGSVSAVSPEASVVLTATGTVNVNAPVFQPSSATGYGVAMSLTPGTETIQSTVTGWTQYHQTTNLITGSVPQVTNNSVCNVYLSDELIPTGTNYTVNLLNKNGSQVAGFPQTWCTYGGAGGTINVSQGAPTGTCNTNGVFYPTPIFSNPPGSTTQSINGSLSIGGVLTVPTIKGPVNVNGALSASAITSGTVTATSLTSGSITSPNINSVVNLDGATYPFTSAGLNAAIAAACNGTLPGTVMLPPGNITGMLTQLTAVSNCTVKGAGKVRTVLQVSSGYNTSPFFLISAVTKFRLEGVGFDATGNTNALDAIDVNNSSDVVISDVSASNWTAGNGIVFNTTNYSKIVDSELFNLGPALPALGASILVQAGSSHDQFLRNKIHDGNIGFLIFNSPTSSVVTEDILLSQNQVWANANDGTLAQASSPLGGPILGERVEDNEVSCNGYNGTAVQTSCPAGFRQTGVTASSSGVGIDMIGPLIQYPVIVGNRSHDNTFDGISIDARMFATETVAGAAVTCSTCGISAPAFNTAWHANEFVSIGGTACQISSVGSTTTMTLTSSCGANGQFQGPTYVGGVISGNTVWHNGDPVFGGAGAFQEGADGNTWTGNTSTTSNKNGFGCVLSNFTAYVADVAISNNRQNVAGSNGGFTIQNCAFTTISAPITADPVAVPTQVNGVLNSGSFNTAIVGCPMAAGAGVTLSDSSTSVGTSFNNCGKPLGTSLNLTAQVANIAAQTIYTTLTSPFSWGGIGVYRVCAALWPTVIGNSTVVANAIAPSGAGTVTIPIGTSLNTAALTNGGGGCTEVQAAANSAIQVSVTGYNTTGTFSIKATVEPAILQ